MKFFALLLLILTLGLRFEIFNGQSNDEALVRNLLKNYSSTIRPEVT
jgi:hypothetical protein